MLTALEGALERERQFVNDASHELRTPLTLLTTRLQLARRRSRSVTELEAVLAEIETDVVRLVALAEHLLTLGHHRDGDPGGDLGGDAGSDLAELGVSAAERRNALLPPADPRRVSVRAAGPVRVLLPSAAVDQVVGNLLDNAARHGAPPVTLAVDAVDAVDGFARVRVTDAGAGMDPDLLATATRRFTRSAASRSREGFGLGLSLAERIVTGAGGQVRLCFDGEHARHGGTAGPDDVACEHSEAMTVTVLLPRASRAVQP